jgi:hypothetical protein
MKPTLPDDREIGEEAAEISRRYREVASEQPSPRIDAAILDAARREAARPPVVRNWQIPAAVAAVLVIGVSLSLLTREGVDSLPPLDQSRKQAEVAKPSAPSLAMKSEAFKNDVDARSRPSRDRSERGDREAEVRRGEEAVIGHSQVPAAPAPAPPPPPVQQFDAPAATAQAPAANATADSVARAQSGVVEALKEPRPAEGSLQDEQAAEKKALTDAAGESRAKSLRKQQSAAVTAPRSPEQMLRDIEELIRNGRQADARLQLAEFRNRYPDYRLPEALQAFEREARPDKK